jgi:hypothetical protein
VTAALRAGGNLRTMHNLARLFVIASAIAACNSTPSTPPATPPGSAAPVQTAASPDATQVPGATGTPDSGAPTSTSKIADALASGTIDEPTSLLYRLYASFNDDRLPAEYQGAWSEDLDASHRVRELWDTLSVDVQAALLPFMVRPTSAKSIWAPAVSASRGGAALTSVRLAGTTCQDGFIHRQVSATVPVVIWGQCGGMSEAAVQAEVDESAQHMAELWLPMTNYMGEPIGDANVAGDAFADSPEGGDGLIDIYLVAPAVTLHGRALGTTALGVTEDWTPWVGNVGAQASSGYIVINTANVSGIQLRSTLAHEFFHVLQNAHNNSGLWLDPGLFWFIEASAVWAQDEFVPESAATKGYQRFSNDFQTTGAPLWFTDGRNEYASFAWPLFMQQELGRPAVANAWKGFEGKSGYDSLTAVLDGLLSFKDHVRDFAVRVWNQDMEPGDPVAPRFQVLDQKFPTSKPGGARASLGQTITTAAKTYDGYLQPLWSYYFEFKTAADVKAITFDFTGMSVAEELDVELLLKIKGTWQRQRATMGGDEKFCDATEAVVVIANHTTAQVGPTQSSFVVQGDANACNAKGTWTVNLSGPRSGAGTYKGTSYIGCVATPGPGGALQWTAVMQDLNNPISSINLGENPSGWDSVSVQAPGGIETGLWFFRSDSAQTTADVHGSGDESAAVVTGDATFVDSEGKKFSATVTLNCSDIVIAQ